MDGEGNHVTKRAWEAGEIDKGRGESMTQEDRIVTQNSCGKKIFRY